jgi:hypothetical protein
MLLESSVRYVITQLMDRYEIEECNYYDIEHFVLGQLRMMPQIFLIVVVVGSVTIKILSMIIASFIAADSRSWVGRVVGVSESSRKKSILWLVVRLLESLVILYSVEKRYLSFDS